MDYYKKSRYSGFTLLELMVVMVILAILASFIFPNVMDAPDQARLVKVKIELKSIEGALSQYKLGNFVYPSTEQGLQALVTKPEGEPEIRHWRRYLPSMPIDPWGNEYLYLSPGQHGDFDIYSLGADGLPNGEGMNADLGNWLLDTG